MGGYEGAVVVAGAVGVAGVLTPGIGGGSAELCEVDRIRVGLVLILARASISWRLASSYCDRSLKYLVSSFQLKANAYLSISVRCFSSSSSRTLFSISALCFSSISARVIGSMPFDIKSTLLSTLATFLM